MQSRRKVVQPGQVRPGQLGYQPVSFRGELNADHSGVGGIGPAPHETGRLGPIHEFHHAVVAEQQVAREIADGRRDPAGMTLDSDKQLVLDVGQAYSASLVLAPSLKAAQADAKGEEVLEVLTGWLRQNCPPIGFRAPALAG